MVCTIYSPPDKKKMKKMKKKAMMMMMIERRRGKKKLGHHTLSDTGAGHKTEKMKKILFYVQGNLFYRTVFYRTTAPIMSPLSFAAASRHTRLLTYT